MQIYPWGKKVTAEKQKTSGEIHLKVRPTVFIEIT
jgi:hypothetical protein